MRLLGAGHELAPAAVYDLTAGRPLEVQDCPRCGCAHSGLVVRRFEPPIVVTETASITDWTMCPIADAPIILAVRVIP
jgi:hypothetical protein